MTRKIILYALLLLAATVVVYMSFYSQSLKELYPGLNWLRVTSLVILVVGCFYAIIERSIVIGAVTFIAAAVLPWVKYWVGAYWPWFKYYYLHWH